MKNILLLCLAILSMATTPYPPQQTGELILTIKNINTSTGKIWVGIYDSKDNFLVQEKSIVFSIPTTGQDQINWSVPDLPYGDYAIGLFHDTNDNDHLDQNFIGIPLEAYGFSGTLRSKWRLPYFDEVKFDLKKPSDTVEVTLQTWSW